MGPVSGQVNAICGHHGQEAAEAFTGRGLQRSRSLGAWFSSDFRELKPLGPDWPPRDREGPLEPKEDS